MTTPCGWSVTECPCGTEDWGALPVAATDYAEAIACSVMWAATGRQYGLCEVTVQPCTRPVDPLYRDYPVPAGGTGIGTDAADVYIADGQWHNAGCGTSCGCSGRCEVALEGPTATAQITSVTVAGVLVPPAAYQIHNRHLLVRIDGQCWPTCRDYSSQTGEFTVVYQRGTPTPAAVQQAVNRLACELYRSCAGGDCRLPNRVKTLTRQGVTVEMADLTDPQGRIRTGIPEVDSLITALNPRGLAARPMVMSPDLPPPRVIT